MSSTSKRTGKALKNERAEGNNAGLHLYLLREGISSIYHEENPERVGEENKMTEERKKCPFNHTMMCPHQLQDKDPIWCQLCILAQLVKAIERL